MLSLLYASSLSSVFSTAQKHLIEVTEAIDARLEYFKELETATRALSQPGDMVVLQEDFLNMVHRLDACLDFLKTKVSGSFSSAGVDTH